MASNKTTEALVRYNELLSMAWKTLDDLRSSTSINEIAPEDERTYEGRVKTARLWHEMLRTQMDSLCMGVGLQQYLKYKIQARYYVVKNDRFCEGIPTEKMRFDHIEGPWQESLQSLSFAKRLAEQRNERLTSSQKLSRETSYFVVRYDPETDAYERID